MARRAPAVERAIAVLNFLASHPGERFTLSEIAREVDLNKATLHAILGALTQAGYLLREEPKKSYGLGPSLIALGNSALDTNPVVQIAVPEMQALSDELSLDCVCSSAIHGEILILAASSPRPFGIYVLPGQRLPLVPPLGTVFVAWSDSTEIDRWLSKLGPRINKGDRDRYRSAVDAVRVRGYSIGLEGEAQQRLVKALSYSAHEGSGSVRNSVRRLRTDEYALIELEPARTYRLNHIGAPVFDPNGDVALGIFLIGFQGDIPAEDVPRFAERLVAAAHRVTKAIHGRSPEHFG
jgi:DNA-binding IclR family transcriptional regulator